MTAEKDNAAKSRDEIYAEIAKLTKKELRKQIKDLEEKGALTLDTLVKPFVPYIHSLFKNQSILDSVVSNIIFFFNDPNLNFERIKPICTPTNVPQGFSRDLDKFFFQKENVDQYTIEVVLDLLNESKDYSDYFCYHTFPALYCFFNGAEHQDRAQNFLRAFWREINKPSRAANIENFNFLVKMISAWLINTPTFVQNFSKVFHESLEVGQKLDVDMIVKAGATALAKSMMYSDRRLSDIIDDLRQNKDSPYDFLNFSWNLIHFLLPKLFSLVNFSPYFIGCASIKNMISFAIPFLGFPASREKTEEYKIPISQGYKGISIPIKPLRNVLSDKVYYTYLSFMDIKFVENVLRKIPDQSPDDLRMSKYAALTKSFNIEAAFTFSRIEMPNLKGEEIKQFTPMVHETQKDFKMRFQKIMNDSDKDQVSITCHIQNFTTEEEDDFSMYCMRQLLLMMKENIEKRNYHLRVRMEPHTHFELRFRTSLFDLQNLLAKFSQTEVPYSPDTLMVINFEDYQRTIFNSSNSQDLASVKLISSLSYIPNFFNLQSKLERSIQPLDTYRISCRFKKLSEEESKTFVELLKQTSLLVKHLISGITEIKIPDIAISSSFLINMLSPTQLPNDETNDSHFDFRFLCSSCEDATSYSNLICLINLVKQVLIDSEDKSITSLIPGPVVAAYKQFDYLFQKE